MTKHHAFTARFPFGTKSILSQAHIGQPFSASNTPDPSKFKFRTYTAIWDTGATHSVISNKVAAECGLKPIDIAEAITVGGPVTQLVYLISIRLPNNVGFASVRVTAAKEIGGCDVLIGMDVISEGDFSITRDSSSNEIVFSFCIPPIKVIDFVELQRTMPRNKKKNKK